jgi:hypothetical protein
LRIAWANRPYRPHLSGKWTVWKTTDVGFLARTTQRWNVRVQSPVIPIFQDL